jgi:AcrR family transcriptional regulator
MATRRERLRAQTLQEIEDASLAIIDADGVEALSFAGLGRSMAMSAPAFYRYFPSRENLLRQLAAAMSRAVAGSGKPPLDQIRLQVGAYRDWALRYRRRYGLLVGESAGNLPAGTPGDDAMNQAMALLIDLLVAGEGAAASGCTSADATLDGQLRLWARSQNRPETPPRAAPAAILIWTRVHGIVSLEHAGVFDNHSIDAARMRLRVKPSDDYSMW